MKFKSKNIEAKRRECRRRSACRRLELPAGRLFGDGTKRQLTLEVESKGPAISEWPEIFCSRVLAWHAGGYYVREDIYSKEFRDEGVVLGGEDHPEEGLRGKLIRFVPRTGCLRVTIFEWTENGQKMFAHLEGWY